MRLAFVPQTASEEKTDIASAQAGDSDAMLRLLQGSAPLIKRDARRTNPQGPAEDAFMAGVAGFIAAVKRFDTARAVRIYTYAMHYVRHAVQQDRIAVEGSACVPWKARVDSAHNYTETTRTQAQQALATAVRLDKPIGDKETPLGDLLNLVVVEPSNDVSGVLDRIPAHLHETVLVAAEAPSKAAAGRILGVSAQTVLDRLRAARKALSQ